MTFNTEEDMMKFASTIVDAKNVETRKPLLKTNNLLRCDPSKPEFFKWLSRGTGAMNKPSVTRTHKDSHCFDSTEMSWEFDNTSQLTVTIKVNDPAKSWNCSDAYLLQVGSQLQFQNIFFHGTHHYTFKNLSEQDIEMVSTVGVQPFLFCDNVAHLVPDLIKTIGLFLGGLGLVHSPNVPFFGLKPWVMQKKWNVDFIKKSTGFQW